MANEMTKIIDTITPEQYTTYTNYTSEKHSAFLQSGILVNTPQLNQMIVSGGKLVTMPEWNQANLTDQTIEEDVALETGKVKASAQIAPVVYRGTGASYSDLSAIVSGSNPAAALLNSFADYTTTSDQAILQAIVDGLFAPENAEGAKGALHDTHISDQSGNVGLASVISPEMVIDARSILGTSRGKIGVIAMHSKVKTELEKQDVQTKHYIPASESKSGFDTYLGMRVVEDDTLKADADNVYRTYMYATNSFGRNTATPADLVTYEPDREAAKGNNMLYVRRARVIHPLGIKFNSAQVSKETPTNADFMNPANWSRVREEKKIGIICLKHKISVDVTETTNVDGV